MMKQILNILLNKKKKEHYWTLYELDAKLSRWRCKDCGRECDVISETIHKPRNHGNDVKCTP